MDRFRGDNISQQPRCNSIAGDPRVAARIRSATLGMRMRDQRLVRTLRTFLDCRRGSRDRGRIALADRYVQQELPCSAIAQIVVKNCLSMFRKSELEYQRAAEGLGNLFHEGGVDFVSQGTSPSGVLEYLAGAPKDSRKVFSRYGGDVATSATTFKVTKFDCTTLESLTGCG
jgi:hypothetical protein